MNGGQAFCYAAHRRGEDDMDRNRRQLQVMRAFFLRLLMDGEIARLPELYAEFKDTVKTDLTLVDLLADIPLAIQLADPQRMAYHQISWDEVTQWLMPGRAKSIVLLPNREALTGTDPGGGRFYHDSGSLLGSGGHLAVPIDPGGPVFVYADIHRHRQTTL